jgi:broad specificity phosphatase PhoE
VVARLRAASGDVLVFGHGHFLRALGARWIDLPVAFGSRLLLSTASVSVLGYEHGPRDPAIKLWNDVHHLTGRLREAPRPLPAPAGRRPRSPRRRHDALDGHPVRHAEKNEHPPGGDAGLTTKGTRARRELARTLEGAGVRAVYASQYGRTRLTAAPLAEAIGDSVRTYDANHLEPLAQRVLRKGRGARS